MKKKYLGTIVAVLLLRVTDLFLTWIYTPDLTEEYNPIVSLLGSSWTGLITTQLIFIAIISLFGAFYFFMKPNGVIQKNLNISDYIYCYFFHELRPWPQRFFTKPTNHKPHLIFNDFMFLSVAILISIFAIFNNSFLILEVTWYETFLADHFSIFFPFVFILITTISFFLFFGRNYYQYKTELTEEQS